MIDTPALSQSQVRNDLQSYFSELQAHDPRPQWRVEQENGVVSGIDQVFHFFFDNNDFDETAVGVTLRSNAEVQLVGALKKTLVSVLEAVGDLSDDDFVLHPLWAKVRQAAAAAAIGVADNQNVS